MPLKILLVLMWVDFFAGAVSVWSMVGWLVGRITKSNLGISHPWPSFVVFTVTVILAWVIAKASDRFETAQPPAGG